MSRRLLLICLLPVVLSAGCGSSHHSAPPPPSATPSSSPSSSPSPSPSASPSVSAGYTSALASWRQGASATSAAMGFYWRRAASDLTGSGVTGASNAVSELDQLASLPDNMQTAAQQAQSQRITLALNAFFGTNGLYDFSAPSPTPAAFIDTLQQEARSGLLSAVPHTAALGDATLTCPVLPSVAVNTAFGCTIASTQDGPFTFVGEIEEAQGVQYLVFIAKGAARIPCSSIDSAEQAVLVQLHDACG